MKNSKKFMWIIIGMVIGVLDILIFVMSGTLSIVTQLIVQVALWILMIILSKVDKDFRILYLTILLTSFILYWLIILILFSTLSKGIMW